MSPAICSSLSVYVFLWYLEGFLDMNAWRNRVRKAINKYRTFATKLGYKVNQVGVDFMNACLLCLRTFLFRHQMPKSSAERARTGS